MPRSFDMATEYRGTVTQVHDAFCDRNYWEARLAESGADEAILDVFRVGHDGGVDVVTTQVLRADRLPGIINQFHRGDLYIRRAETWTGLFDDTAQATIAGSIERAPVALNGEARLVPLDERAQLAFQASVEVRIPLVGRKMENFIGTQLMNLLTNEQQFTTRWIAGDR
ncbi:MAG: DUF2505 domain-containing protein [Mycobacteriaceae bacterium]